MLKIEVISDYASGGVFKRLSVKGVEDTPKNIEMKYNEYLNQLIELFMTYPEIDIIITKLILIRGNNKICVSKDTYEKL